VMVRWVGERRASLIILCAGGGARSWREVPVDRDEATRATARSHRDNVLYDRGDYTGRRKRFDRFADDDDEEDGNVTFLLVSKCGM